MERIRDFLMIVRYINIRSIIIIISASPISATAVLKLTPVGFTVLFARRPQVDQRDIMP